MMLARQLRNELWKLFGKKRTYIGFGFFLVAELLIICIFRYSNATRPLRRVLEGNDYLAEQFISAQTIATLMVASIAYTLMPLYVALIGGDLVSKEAEDGTLRMILSRPISRVRLLAVKWLAGVVFAVVLVACLAIFGLLFASIWFPAGGSLFVVFPGDVFSTFDPGPGLRRYLAAHCCMVVKACTIMGLAFMFSCFRVKPAAATILALSVLFVNSILMEMPYFQDLKYWFLTHHLNVWRFMFSERIPWPALGESLSIMAGFNITFFVIGATAFQLRDIKS